MLYLLNDRNSTRSVRLTSPSVWSPLSIPNSDLPSYPSTSQLLTAIYSFITHQRSEDTQYLYGASVIIVEGILALNDPRMRDLFDLKVFVNVSSLAAARGFRSSRFHELTLCF